MKIAIKLGKCMVCHRPEEVEGIEITRWRFIKTFICKGCVSKLFSLFGKKN